MDELKLYTSPFAGIKTDTYYVAFIDILGFGQQVLDNFDQTLDVYEEIINDCFYLERWRTTVKLNIYSDSIIMVSVNIEPLIEMAVMVELTALKNYYLVRGGIGLGKHIENNQNGNVYMISEALVNAVRLEKEIKMPCIVLHSSIKLPDTILADPRRLIILYEDKYVLNPFWNSKDLRDSLITMAAEAKRDKDKYEWLLRFYDAAIMKAMS
jgi:hypothetical protein